MFEKQQKKVWISKYALTQGIYEKIVEIDNEFPKMCNDVEYTLSCFHKPFWSDTRKEAVAQAKKMQKAKIASIKRQLKKLEEMTF